MTLYDISGNEIHGKEVVFERACNTDCYTEPLVLPEQFAKIVYLGNTKHYDAFSCYVGVENGSYLYQTPFLYLGQLKDK